MQFTKIRWQLNCGEHWKAKYLITFLKTLSPTFHFFHLHNKNNRKATKYYSSFIPSPVCDNIDRINYISFVAMCE